MLLLQDTVTMNLQLDLTLKCIMIILQLEQFLLTILTIQATTDHTTTELNNLKKQKNDLNYGEMKKLDS